MRLLAREVVAMLSLALGAALSPVAVESQAAAPETAGSFPHQVDISAGGLIPFSADQRDAYGTAGGATIGYAPRLGRGTTHLILDVGVVHSSGDEFAEDPTFEMDRASYTLYPISVGVRTNLVRDASEGPVYLYFGTAIQWVPLRWRASTTLSGSTSTVGALFELRPEFRVSPRWSVWVRNRITLLADTNRKSPLSQVNYSGSLFELGLSFHP
jgi:hypothetical protein